MTVEIEGLKRAQDDLNKAIKDIEKRNAKGVFKGALEIKRTAASRNYCPVDWGNLRASAYALPKNIPGIALRGSGTSPSFPHDAPYATGKKAGALASNHKSAINEKKKILNAMEDAGAIVGFTAYYAPIVHESPYAGKNNGGPKFLQKAVKVKREAVIAHIMKEAK